MQALAPTGQKPRCGLRLRLFHSDAHLILGPLGHRDAVNRRRVRACLQRLIPHEDLDA